MLNHQCEEMFDTLGYGPMTKFYAKDGGKQAFDDYAELVVKEMCTSFAFRLLISTRTLSLFVHSLSN